MPLFLFAQPRRYIGEDVEHGGYYLVTENMSKKFPQRVRDFPPDETALLAMGQGFAHAGMVPIVEIPYAKYAVPAPNMAALCHLLQHNVTRIPAPHLTGWAVWTWANSGQTRPAWQR